MRIDIIWGGVIFALGAATIAWWWFRRPQLRLLPNIAGTWSFTITDDDTNCGGGVTTYDVIVTVTQDGNNITLTFNGVTLTGSFVGRRLTASGSYAAEGGTIEENLTALLTDTGLSGTSTWTWQQGSDQCVGTSTFEGVRT